MNFYQSFDSKGRIVIRLNSRRGRILVRWRNDMPGQNGRYQFVRERKAVKDGYGDICYAAIQCALYHNGIGTFSPAVHAPELGYHYYV